MNDLSWMLYAADVVGNIASMGAFATIAGALGGITTFIFVAGKTDLDNIGAREKIPAIKTGWASAKGFFIASIVAAIVTIPVPSKDTIYAIAASEMGEEALKSPIATKAGKALEKWLDNQISDDQKGGE